MVILANTTHNEVTSAPETHGGGENDMSFQGKAAAVDVIQLDIHDGRHMDTSVQANILQTTRPDAQDMDRMGKRQELVRHFRQVSIISFSFIVSAAWEFSLFSLTPALLNGGSPALLWTLIWNFCCFGPVLLSLAEMASMAPTAGGQYHWVSEFAPEGSQQILSYLTGWISTLAWQAGNASSALLAGTIVQVIIETANPDYNIQAWHVALLTIADVIIAYIGTVYGNSILPRWQTGAFVFHVLSFCAVIIPIWVSNAESATHRQVWIEFTTNSGWAPMGLAVLVGQLSAIYSFTGLDTTAHMAEEVKNASKSIPVAMLSVYVMNFAMTFLIFLTICYHISDVTAALDDPSTYPSFYVLRQAVPSGGFIALLCVTLLLVIASNIVYLVAVTRDLFAFARDQGLPFASWLSKVDHKRHVPANACLVSSFVAASLSLIYLGSSVAYYAITSLFTVALLAGYVLSIGCCLWRRVNHPETMPPARFSLGRWGAPLNAFAVIYCSWAFFWCLWPTSTPVDASSFNWASPIFVATVLFSLCYFFISGRYSYKGPVVHVTSRNLGVDRPMT